MRAARKLIQQALKERTPGGNLSKCVLAYAPMVNIFEASRLHGAQGLQDQAASEMFEATVATLEQRFESAFQSLEDWADPPAASNPKDIVLNSRKSELASLQTSLVGMYGALARWSSATLQEQLELFSDTISNIMGLLAASSWTFCTTFARSLRAAFQLLLGEAEVARHTHWL